MQYNHSITQYIRVWVLTLGLKPYFSAAQTLAPLAPLLCATAKLFPTAPLERATFTTLYRATGEVSHDLRRGQRPPHVVAAGGSEVVAMAGGWMWLGLAPLARTRRRPRGRRRTEEGGSARSPGAREIDLNSGCLLIPR